MKKFALIVAGGSGNRMGTQTPKQFLEITGKPILMHTIDVFYRYDPDIEIIIVLPEQQTKTWEILCKKFSFHLTHKVCRGGEKRFFSVKNGLEEILEDGIVFIHDGVRPLVSIDTIIRCFEMAKLKGNAIPVIPVTESLRRKENNIMRPVDRSEYFLVQTPQTFSVSEIKGAYMQEYSQHFTDDASVLQATGKAINTVEGNQDNIKITYPNDILTAEALL